MRAGGGGDGARRPDRPREPPSRRLVLEIITISVYLGLMFLLLGGAPLGDGRSPSSLPIARLDKLLAG